LNLNQLLSVINYSLFFLYLSLGVRYNAYKYRVIYAYLTVLSLSIAIGFGDIVSYYVSLLLMLLCLARYKTMSDLYEDAVDFIKSCADVNLYPRNMVVRTNYSSNVIVEHFKARTELTVGEPIIGRFTLYSDGNLYLKDVIRDVSGRTVNVLERYTFVILIVEFCAMLIYRFI